VYVWRRVRWWRGIHEHPELDQSARFPHEATLATSAIPQVHILKRGLLAVYDRTRANPRNFNATHWIGHASAMEHGTIFFDLKITLEHGSDGSAHFSARLPDSMLPSFSSAYNTAFVTVSYGLCLHSESGEVLSVEPLMLTQNAPEESGRMNKKTRLATFVTRNLNWYVPRRVKTGSELAEECFEGCRLGCSCVYDHVAVLSNLDFVPFICWRAECKRLCTAFSEHVRDARCKGK
jgi:hypothetical protein